MSMHCSRNRGHGERPFAKREAGPWLSLLSLTATLPMLACTGAEPDASQPESLTTAALQSTSSGTDDATALTASTRFFIPSPNPGAVTQFADLLRGKQLGAALRLAEMEATPQAVWFTGGTPAEVETGVRKIARSAAREGRVPVLVAYNVPFRDCAGYSGGGATDTAAYQAWIDGFVRGVGGTKAVVILEPDSLGIIPYNTTIYGAADWCKPTVSNELGQYVPAPGASPAERYAQLNYAVDAFAAKAPRTLVYLDGTHSGWLGVGEAAYRLVGAGVKRAQGFFLNVSNFQLTSDNTQFGLWVSDCITAATAGAPWAAGHFDWCPSQYDPATNYSTVNFTPDFAAKVTASLVNLMGGAAATTHFVIDTSRNGQGPWTPTAVYPDPQVWCNPPGRGLGLRPTASTGTALADAYLWIKPPGESDGACNRGIAGGTTDPEWGGIADPAAGVWFPQQALQLGALASPALP